VSAALVSSPCLSRTLPGLDPGRFPQGACSCVTSSWHVEQQRVKHPGDTSSKHKALRPGQPPGREETHPLRVGLVSLFVMCPVVRDGLWCRCCWGLGVAPLCDVPSMAHRIAGVKSGAGTQAHGALLPRYRRALRCLRCTGCRVALSLRLCRGRGLQGSTFLAPSGCRSHSRHTAHPAPPVAHRTAPP
jgi:hypothetical protein